ncbi:MAG TPA: proline dehydrogenase family protein [Solirubrobacteraceae bacterium]|nr:proline dehydrogenase family protein [Solirubrobacteraceae bacterium]
MAPLSRHALFVLATSDRFERAVRAVPGGAAAAYRLASPYVAGTTDEDALDAARELAGRGVHSSIDFFGENVTDPREADLVADEYVRLAARLTGAPPGTFLSLDLSHIGLDESGEAVARRLERIAAALPEGARVQVGGEQAARTDRILEAVLVAARAAGLRGARGSVGATVQANLRRSARDAIVLAEAGVPIRLVKGAYVESSSVAHPWGDPTDVAFAELAHALHRAGAEISLATHDPVLQEALLPALPGAGVEMLLGVREWDQASLVARGIPLRLYVPFGGGWFRYAMRRWAESRGAR